MSDDDSDQNDDQNARLDRWAGDNDGLIDGGPFNRKGNMSKKDLQR